MRADLLEDQGQLGEAGATAADVLRQRCADQPCLGHAAPEVLVVPLAGSLELGEPRRRRPLGQHAPGQVDQRLLVLGQSEVHCRPLYRGARGMASPTIEMMSRWISLVPPPKVSTSVLRIARSRSAFSTAPAESLVSVEHWPTISISAR